MRYPVGSISKEFTATALLLLQESHALSLDDPAGHWVSGLGPAAAVSLRALLSHTSGVRDFWPQDFPTPDMFEPIDPQRIVARWANQPLDFPPGTAWQYSNTGYVIAGLAAEKAGGRPLFPYLQSKIFEPLAMHSVIDVNSRALADDDAVGYRRFALGPPRPAPASGVGWLFGAGELAMTPSDLSRWDIALIEHQILNPASLHELGTEVRLENGAGTNYGLGLFVNLKAGRRVLSHGGEIDGFTAENRIYPDDGAAVVVLTNEDATHASATIADALAEILLTRESDADARVAANSRVVLRELQSGTLDRSRFTTNGNSYFTDEALADFKFSLSALGEPTSFTLTRAGQRGGFGFHVYDMGFARQHLRLVVRTTADGRFEQFTVSAE